MSTSLKPSGDRALRVSGLLAASDAWSHSLSALNVSTARALSDGCTSPGMWNEMLPSRQQQREVALPPGDAACAWVRCTPDPHPVLQAVPLQARRADRCRIEVFGFGSICALAQTTSTGPAKELGIWRATRMVNSIPWNTKSDPGGRVRHEASGQIRNALHLGDKNRRGRGSLGLASEPADAIGDELRCLRVRDDDVALHDRDGRRWPARHRPPDQRSSVCGPCAVDRDSRPTMFVGDRVATRKIGVTEAVA